MSIRSLCIHTIDIEQNTGVQDGAMNTPETWVAKYAGVAARIMPVGADVNYRWGGQPAIGTHKIFMADTNLDIAPENRIRFGTRIFTIEGGPRNVDEMNMMLVIDAREVT